MGESSEKGAKAAAATAMSGSLAQRVFIASSPQHAASLRSVVLLAPVDSVVSVKVESA